MTITTHSTNGAGAPIKWAKVYTVTEKIDAATLNPTLTGVAGELTVHNQEPANSAFDWKDYLIEQIGLLQSTVGDTPCEVATMPDSIRASRIRNTHFNLK